MKRQHSVLLGIVAIAAALGATHSLGQVDPSWLNSWNEGQERRPGSITSSSNIASADAAGIPLVIRGLVVAPDGTVAEGVLVHAYHRDADGFEFGPNDNSYPTWALQGWAHTDALGRFQFRTIRPAPDHLGREGAHVHFTLESAEFGRQWAPKIFFADDQLVPAHQRQQSKKAGEFGAVRELRIVDGVQHIAVKLQLKAQADF